MYLPVDVGGVNTVDDVVTESTTVGVSIAMLDDVVTATVARKFIEWLCNYTH